MANVRNYLYCFLLILLFSCNSDEGLSCLPNSTIDVSINLSLPAYIPLQSNNGYVYYNGELSGTKGLIIVNAGGGNYKAYDRNAPHICPTNNSTLVVENDIILRCPEDEATWILTTGEPITVANRAPRTYQVSKNGNILFINN